MHKTGIPYLDFGWNPCGFGCSRGCPTCWARTQAAGPYIRRTCEACGRFEVHFHPERLDQPAKRKKPAVVGVEFTGELFDAKRPRAEIRQVLDAAAAAYWNTLVFLTHAPGRAVEELAAWIKTAERNSLPANWWIGATATDAASFDRAVDTLHDLAGGHLWLSLEPLAGFVGEWMPDHIEGVIIGANNRPGEPWDMDWARQARDIAQDAGMAVYVKQLWMWQCGCCGAGYREDIDGRCPVCNDGRLYRTRVKDPALSPDDLRQRDLPWQLTTKEA